MTPEQITALRAACFADPTAAAFFTEPGDAPGLMVYLNGASGVNAWKTDAQVTDILDGIDFSKYTPNDAISGSDSGDTLHRKNGWLLTAQTKQMNLQLMLQGRITINCSSPTVRAGLRDAVINLPTGSGGANTSPGGASGATMLAKCVRPATRAEIMLAATSQASDTTGGVTGRVLTFEGELYTVTAVMYKDNGDIWTP